MKRFTFLLVGLLMVTASLTADNPQPVDDDSQRIEYQMGSPDMIPTPDVAMEVQIPDRGDTYLYVTNDSTSETASVASYDLSRYRYDTNSISYNCPFTNNVNSIVYDTAVPPDLDGQSMS